MSGPDVFGRDNFSEFYEVMSSIKDLKVGKGSSL
jgi:hypothetical protein